MTERMQDYGNGFHHIRGEFRLGGVVNIGTHCAIVELPDGGFLFLDSYDLPDAIRREIDALTDGGSQVKAIANLHPFHTMHCEWMHRTFPNADLYGTRRHHDKLPHLPWQESLCESDALQKRFGDTMQFSVPRGVDLVCEKESVHFGSVLAFHPASGTIFVDDTLSYLKAPFPLSRLPMTGRLDFHPALPGALKRERGAAKAFREWAYELAEQWQDTRRIATAHNATLELERGQFPELIGAALGRVRGLLDRHEAIWS